MRDSTCILFAILLNARTTKEYSLPYHADSPGECKNPEKEYPLDDASNLCCSKCPPGKKLIKNSCSDTNDSECQECDSGQYLENSNYAPNCRKCPECKTDKGLQYAQNCNSTTKSKCVCQTGWYCIMDFEDPYCTDCEMYKSCKAGEGVSREGGKDYNVRCKKCPDGTFSDKISYAERCRPHTDCQGRAIVKHGNATSDTVCEPAVAAFTTLHPRIQTDPHGSTVHQTMNLQTTANPSSLPSRPVSDPVVIPEEPTKTQIPTQWPNSGPQLVAVIAGVTGLLMVFIIVLVLLIRRKTIPMNGEEAQTLPPKIDANGNCERDNDVNPCHSTNVELVAFSNISPEQQCLLRTEEPYNKSG